MVLYSWLSKVDTVPTSTKSVIVVIDYKKIVTPPVPVWISVNKALELDTISTFPFPKWSHHGMSVICKPQWNKKKLRAYSNVPTSVHKTKW